MSMIVIWSVAAVIFIIFEAATVGLSSIWFALGAICALISALLGAKLWLQIVWFLVISVAALLLTRPLVRKYVNGRSSATNADRVIGTVCRVTESIDNYAGTGAVSAIGKVWTARSGDDRIIECGTLVKVKEIQGVKLIVEKAAEKETTAEIN